MFTTIILGFLLLAIGFMVGFSVNGVYKEEQEKIYQDEIEKLRTSLNKKSKK